MAEIRPPTNITATKDVESKATNTESDGSTFVAIPMRRDIKLTSKEADIPYSENVGDEQSSSTPTCMPSTAGTQGAKTIRNVNRPSRRYYIDELGFYRHLDPDQRQYVCSNLNDMRPPKSQNPSASSRPTAIKGNSRYISLADDGGFESCSRIIRDNLGISHFDRLVGYDKWKQGWDEFIRDKLLKRETVTFNQTLKLKVRTGIPHDYRRKVWTALIIMRTRNLRAQVGYDIYENLLDDYVHRIGIPKYDSVSKHESERYKDRGENDDSSKSFVGAQKNPFNCDDNYSSNNRRAFEANLSKQAAEKIFKQIELDLLRTLPNNQHFEDPNSKGVERVRRVLRAYACFNPVVGYCQGMNRLAAMALLVLPEEEAFWCLVAIIQCIMPKDYYLKPWLAQVDCYVLGELLEKKMPELHKHLVKNDIQLTLFTWFFTIYVDGFRPELMLRIWDCFLVEGDKVLFRVALAILYIAQDDLLGMHDISNMSSYLSQLVSTRKLDTELLFESE